MLNCVEAKDVDVLPRLLLVSLIFISKILSGWYVITMVAFGFT